MGLVMQPAGRVDRYGRIPHVSFREKIVAGSRLGTGEGVTVLHVLGNFWCSGPREESTDF
ncbi:MAG: hypothetical protein NVS2B16_08010 [Chloroflexota bacterium]